MLMIIMANSSHEKDQILVGKCNKKEVAYLTQVTSGSASSGPTFGIKKLLNLGKAFSFSSILTP